jgi:hypothetical protein
VGTSKAELINAQDYTDDRFLGRTDRAGFRSEGRD